MAYLVYRLTNTVNGKSYIGITSRSLADRWSEHQKRSREGLRNSRLHQAMRKYGHDVFTKEVLATAATADDLRELETKFIQQFDTMANGYNCNEGGTGFLDMPDHIKRKIGEAQKGKIVSQECKAKMSAAKLGDPRCADHLGEHVHKGSKNPRATWFAMSCPDGILRIERGLRAFCRKHKLVQCHLYSRGHTKGFHLIDTFTSAVPPTAHALI